MSVIENRIPPPLVVLLLGAAMWLTARYTPHALGAFSLRMGMAAVVFLLGVTISGSGVRAFARAKTTIDPVHLEAASALVTTGVFRFSRNPMYVGFSALLLAWAVFLGAPWALVGVIAFVVFISRYQILPEERMMWAKFGAGYEEYRRRVRRWL